MSMLRDLRVATGVITGDGDLVPVDVGERSARALTNARLVTMSDCGQFACLEFVNAMCTATDAVFRGR